AGQQPTARTQYLAADGKYVNIGLPYQQAAWEKLSAYLQENGMAEGLPLDELNDQQKRFQMGSVLMDILQVLISRLTSVELFHLGQSMGMTWGAVQQPEAWLDDPHAAERGFFVEVDHPELGRTVTYPGAPYKFMGSPWSIRRRAPLLGEDNAVVYGDLGLSAADLTALRESGAI
ncbi:MAG TPA: CoA transferase, partial [Dehalococcoidia bacterium]